jgi:hypothetical protein
VFSSRGSILAPHPRKPANIASSRTYYLPQFAPSKKERGTTWFRNGSPMGNAISFRIEGRPPEPQTIRVTANPAVTVSRLELLLPHGRCVADQECSYAGDAIDIPISQNFIAELFRAPRPSGSTYDSSFNFRVTASAGGMVRTYTFRAQVSVVLVGDTVYHRVSGSQDFA